jgi:hypothetical protein
LQADRCALALEVAKRLLSALDGAPASSTVIGSNGRRRQSIDRSPVASKITTAVRVLRSGSRWG